MSERPSTALKASSAPDPLVGRTINGRFNIVSLIARGGMGKVYRAEQAPLGRVCALKILTTNYTGDGDPEFQKRFFLEASIASKLKHPNTVTVFDYGRSEDDIFYMAMELLEGKTLHKAIRESIAMPEERAMHVARQICRSLREAHQMGVIHRDLKPANIFLTEHGDELDFVKVLDFGLVKNIEEKPDTEQLTHTGLFMGSPKYMAPEQIQGAAVDARTDIYALGVIMYEMLTGKVPFDRATSVNTLMAHVSEPPPPLRAVKADVIVSPALENIVYRCIAKDPNQRFTSMDEVLSVLKQAGGIQGMAATGDYGSFQAIQAAQRAVTASGQIARLSATGSGNMAAQLAVSGSGPNVAQVTPIQYQAPQPLTTRPPPPPQGYVGGPSATQSATPMPLASADLSMQLATPRRSPLLIPLLAAAAVAIGGTLGFAAYRASSSSSSNATSTSSATSTSTSNSNATSTSNTTTTPSASATPNPASVKWMISTDPDGATVRDNGVEICNATPCEIAIAPSDTQHVHKISLTHAGFKTEQRVARVTDGPINVRMTKIGGFRPQPTSRPTQDPSLPPTPPKPTNDTPAAPTPSGFKDTPYGN